MKANSQQFITKCLPKVYYVIHFAPYALSYLAEQHMFGTESRKCLGTVLQAALTVEVYLLKLRSFWPALKRVSSCVCQLLVTTQFFLGRLRQFWTSLWTSLEWISQFSFFEISVLHVHNSLACHAAQVLIVLPNIDLLQISNMVSYTCFELYAKQE